MTKVESTIVFLPRFTTLAGNTTFHTLPLDVSRFGSAQFQVWRGELLDYDGGAPQFQVEMEESIDAQHWALGASSPMAYKVQNDETRFFSHTFRLRWFRLKVTFPGGVEPMVTCWAEGILR